MNLINWITGVTKLSKATMDAFQNNIKDAVDGLQDDIDGLQDDIDSMNEITTGSGTMNSTYTTDVENNHWERVGKVVTYAFTIRATGTWGQTTTFVTGLPKAKANTRFLGVNASNSSSPVMRFIITTDGTIQNAYSQTSPGGNQVIEGQITYITSE